MLRKWWDADKLFDSEELGDLLCALDSKWSMEIFVKSNSHSKV